MGFPTLINLTNLTKTAYVVKQRPSFFVEMGMEAYCAPIPGIAFDKVLSPSAVVIARPFWLDLDRLFRVASSFTTPLVI